MRERRVEDGENREIICGERLRESKRIVCSIESESRFTVDCAGDEEWLQRVVELGSRMILTTLVGPLTNELAGATAANLGRIGKFNRVRGEPELKADDLVRRDWRNRSGLTIFAGSENR